MLPEKKKVWSELAYFLSKSGCSLKKKKRSSLPFALSFPYFRPKIRVFSKKKRSSLRIDLLFPHFFHKIIVISKKKVFTQNRTAIYLFSSPTSGVLSKCQFLSRPQNCFRWPPFVVATHSLRNPGLRRLGLNKIKKQRLRLNKKNFVSLFYSVASALDHIKKQSFALA